MLDCDVFVVVAATSLTRETVLFNVNKTFLWTWTWIFSTTTTAVQMIMTLCSSTFGCWIIRLAKPSLKTKKNLPKGYQAYGTFHTRTLKTEVPRIPPYLICVTNHCIVIVIPQLLAVCHIVLLTTLEAIVVNFLSTVVRSMLPNFTSQTELLMYGTVYPSMLSLHPPCYVLQQIVRDWSRQVLCHLLAPFTITNLYYWYWFLIHLVLVVHFLEFSFRVYCNAMLIVLYDGVSGHQALPFY